MNPAGDGQGYALAATGNVASIGGAPDIAGMFDFVYDSEGGAWMSRRIYMPDWSTKKYVVWDSFGRRWSRNGALSIIGKLPSGQTFNPDIPMYGGDIGKACAF